MSWLRDKLRRWAVATLARKRGEVRAIQELRLLAQSLRFAGVFAVLMLLPTGFLAWQALASVRSEELALDAEMTRRARATTTSIQNALQGVILTFERAALARLDARESVSDNLGELSSNLRAAYRFDADGNLVAPFEFPDEALPAEPPVFWREQARPRARWRVPTPGQPLWRGVGCSQGVLVETWRWKPSLGKCAPIFG